MNSIYPLTELINLPSLCWLAPHVELLKQAAVKHSWDCNQAPLGVFRYYFTRPSIGTYRCSRVVAKTWWELWAWNKNRFPVRGLKFSFWIEQNRWRSFSTLSSSTKELCRIRQSGFPLQKYHFYGIYYPEPVMKTRGLCWPIVQEIFMLLSNSLKCKALNFVVRSW